MGKRGLPVGGGENAKSPSDQEKTKHNQAMDLVVCPGRG